MKARAAKVVTILLTLGLMFAATGVAQAGLVVGTTVEVSDNHSTFNLSVFPGTAGYDDGVDSGVFGDGTVLDYRFFNNTGTTFNGTGYADGGAGFVSPATATNSSDTNGGALHWADVWTTNDPGIDFSGSPANFTTATVARSQGVSGTIDISRTGAGSLYFIYGTYYDANTVALTMTGSGQPDVTAEYTIDPPNTVNLGWITEFTFADADAYDTISYTYTNTDTDASRARFMGVILDADILTATYTWNEVAQPTGNWADTNWVADTGPFPPDPVAPIDEGAHRIKAIIQNGAVVTVAVDQSAAALDLLASQLDISSGASLTVSGGIDATDGTINLATDSALVGGGNVGTLGFAGTAATPSTLNGGASVGTLTDGGAAGFFQKTGDGTLSAETVTAVAGTTFQVSGGTFVVVGAKPLGDATALVLSGGTFRVEGAVTTQPGLLFGSFYENSRPLDPSIPNPGNNGVDPLGPTISEAGGWSTWTTYVYTGQIYDEDGVISFFESIDDETWLEIDDQVVLHDMVWNTPKASGMVNVTPGWVDFEVRFNGGTGGMGRVGDMGFGFDPTGTATSTDPADYILPRNSDAGTADLFRTSVYGPINMTGVALTVTADSTIDVVTEDSATFAAPLMKAGILTTTSPQNAPVTFQGVTIDPAATRVGFDPRTPTTYGTIANNSTQEKLTIVKEGPGTWTLDAAPEGATGTGNVTWEVQDGTFEVIGSEPLGDRPVVMAGGTLRFVSAPSLSIDNPGFEDPVLADGDWSWSMDDEGWGYFDNDGYQGSWNVTTADFPGEAPEGENVGWAEGEGLFGGFAQVLTDPDATLKAGMTYTLSVEVGYALSTDPFGGYTVQLLAGGTPHTPGSGGDYTGPVSGGTLLAEDDNLLTIAQGTFETSTVTYTYDPAHSDLLGEPLQIRLLAYAASDEVEFDNVYLAELPSGTGPPDFSGIALSVTEDSTLDIAVPLVDATFKSLAMQSGTLTTAGAAASIDFTATTFADGSAASGFRTGVPTLLGTTTADGVTPLVVTKTGTSDLILDRAATGLGSTTFDVQQGRLVAVETAAKGNPMDGAALQVGGSEIVLAGRTTHGAVAFDNQVNVSDDATLTAGPGDRGATGPLDVTLGSAGSDTITLSSGTLAVQALDNYTLTVAGNVVGSNGGINAPAGTVTLAQMVDVGSLDVTGGDLTAVMAPTADKMTVSDGQLTTAGATVGNFEISGGVVATTGNLDVTTGRVSGGSFSGLARGESNMVVSDSLNINNVTYSIDAGTFDANGTDLMSEADLTVSGGKLTLTGGVPVPENPQAYYSFDNSADPGHDDSDNAHHGTVTGASWTDAGIVGGALAFDGDDYVDCGSDASLDFPSAITMSAWGYSNSGSNGHIVNRGGGWGDPGYSMFWYGGNIRVELQRPGLKTTSDNPAPAVGEWHHILVTWDDTSDTITTYFNGVAQGNMGSFDGPIGTPNQNLNIGRNELQAYYFDGLIDEVFLYDRTLTEDEIVALYEGGVAGYYGEETVDQPTTNLLVTANTEIASDAPSVTLGNLTVTNPVDPPPTTLTLSDTFYSFNNVTVDDGVTIRGGFAVGGTLSPGSGVGTLNLDGELELIEGIYLCEIDSTGADLIHNANQDEGIILGEGQEGGTLDLLVLEALGVPGCYTDTIISTSGAGEIEGDFPDGQKPAEGDYLDYGVFLDGYETVDTGAGFNYNLNLFQAGQGDTDGDGDVDLDDLSALDDGWAPTADDKIWTDGDVDGDGDVDLDDLSLLDDAWAPAGYPLVNCPFGGGGLGAAAVPEPGTLALLAMGLVCLAYLGRRGLQRPITASSRS